MKTLTIENFTEFVLSNEEMINIRGGNGGDGGAGIAGGAVFGMGHECAPC